MDLEATPLGLLWAMAFVGICLFVGAVFFIMPAALRRETPGRAAALAGLGLIIWLVFSHGNRGQLWFLFIGSIVTALPLLSIGRLPSDMPSRLDPRAHLHPDYETVRKRGRRAGMAYVALILLAAIFTASFVRS
jgi:Ca2+/Na+ antiporter